MSIFLYFHCIAWLSFAGTIVKVTPKKGKATNLKATITVKNPALSVKAAKEVAVGATEQITATVKPANTKVTYTSSDATLATVDEKGVVTGVKAGDVTITVKAGKTTKTVKMTVKEADPKVESVVANNLKTVAVKFNKAIDKDTLTKISIKDVATTNSLSEDKKTAYLVATTPLTQSQKIKLTVDGVKTVDGKDVPKYEEEIVVTDTAIPVLTSAVALNAKQIELTFNEPVNYTYASYTVLNDVKIDGVAAIAKATPNYTTNKVVLELTTVMKAGTKKISVANIADYAGFKMAAYEGSIEVVEDTAAPEIVKAEVVDRTTVRVTFNEAVETVGTFKVNGVTATTPTAVADSNNTQFDLDCNLDLGAVVETKVSYKGQKDVVGNEVKDEKTFSFSTADDTAVPTVALTVGDENKLTLTFSKPMQTAGTIKVIDKNKKVVSTTSVATFKDTKKTVIELAASSVGLTNIDAADYTLNITGMKDNSLRQTALPEQNIVFTAKDTKKPTVTSSYLATSGVEKDAMGALTHKDDTATLYFSEAMDTVSLSNLSNYTYNSVNLSTVPGASVKSIAADGKSIVLTIPSVSEDKDDIVVSGVKDVAGNFVATATPVSVLSSTTLAVRAIEFTSKTEVTMTFDTAIASVDPSAIKVQKSSVDYAIPTNATIDANDATKVKFTLNKALDETDTTNFTVVDNNSELIKSIYGDTFKVESGVATPGDTIVADGITATEKIAPELKSVVGETSGNTITLTFSENIKTGTNTTIPYDITIVVTKDDGTTETLSATDFTAAISSDTVVLTFEEGTEVKGTVTVALTNGRYITDASSNATVAFTAKDVVKGTTGADATTKVVFNKSAS